MDFLHVCIWTKGVINIGHALLMEEGKDAELDLAMVPKAYEWNWHALTTVTCHYPIICHMAKPRINREGKIIRTARLQVTQ